MVHPLLFYLLSGFMVLGALGVLLARRPVYAVLGLVWVLLGMSALFVALEATFVAAIQVLVYAGAVLILFLFVLMLMETEPERLRRAGGGAALRWLGWGFGLLFFWQLARAAAGWGAPSPAAPGVAGTTAAIGSRLFTTYALPFEAASLLLLVGIIGAIVLAKKTL